MQIYGLSKVAETADKRIPFKFTAITRMNKDNKEEVIWPVVKCFAANNEEVACEVRYTYTESSKEIAYD